MSSAGPVDFFVDIERLTDVGREIQSLINALDGTRQGSCPEGAETGSQDVSDAVHRFDNSWQQAKQRLAGHLTACQALVQLAVEKYQETERGLVHCREAGITPAPEGGDQA